MRIHALILGGAVSIAQLLASPDGGEAVAGAHAAEAKPADATPAPDTQAAATTVAPDAETPPAKEVASMLRLGEAKMQQQDWESARIAFDQVLDAGRLATPEQVRAALLGLARTYRGDLRLTKAAAIYERYIKDYPADEKLPVIYLELGRCLRALGAHRLAIARFYSVLNSTLKLPEEGTETYRQLARTAQFEIAETYFQSGDYEQAFRFYSRLRLLDLAPADRARAAFKSAYALNLKGDHEKAVSHLRAYLALYPDGEDAAETRYLLSIALRRLGRSQESLAATLELLKTEQSRAAGAASSKTWSHWQRKTGNQLANEFYEQGDITSALSIYQCLRDLGGPPEWLLPVQYQIGLCQERLHQPALASATYQTILDSLRAPAADSAKPAPAILNDIGAMVTWRLNHLGWLETNEKQSLLFITPVNAPEASPGAPKPAPTVAASTP